MNNRLNGIETIASDRCGIRRCGCPVENAQPLPTHLRMRSLAGVYRAGVYRVCVCVFIDLWVPVS